MRGLLLLLCLLPFAGCKKVVIPRIEREPEPRTAEPEQAVVPEKHPMYVMLEAEPRNDYERALPLMMSKVINVDALQQYCGQWFPDFGRDVADAYLAWRKLNESTIQELRGRSEEVWTRHVPPQDARYARMVEAHLRKQMRASIDREFDARPVEFSRQVCRNLPADLRSARWDLEKKHRKELAFLRQTPFTARH